MIGREAILNPWMFWNVDNEFFGDKTKNVLDIHQKLKIIQEYINYAEYQQKKYQISISYLIKPLENTFNKKFRVSLIENSKLKKDIKEIINSSLSSIY